MIPIRIEKSQFDIIRYEYLKKVSNWLVDRRKVKDDKTELKAQKDIYSTMNLTLKKFGINYSLGEIIIADFDTLRHIKTQLDLNGIVYKAYDNKKNKSINKKECVKDSPFEILYKTFDSKLDKKWLIDKLGITVCPYCNRSFINNIGNRTSAQLDHFFPRSRYPIFSLSICNLIPSCYACNNIKSSHEIKVSPYDKSFNFDDSLRFTFIPKGADFINDRSQLEVDIKAKNGMDENVQVMKIDNAYKIHNDYVQELIKKAELYNKYKLKEYVDNYNSLFSSEEEILRIVFGNYVDEKLIGKRPLAKLTKDILQELKIKL